MYILIAPNAFKNSLTATEAAAAIRDGLLQSRLGCECECFPVGDGGDGTVDLIVAQCKGSWMNSEVADPLGRMISAKMGFIDKGVTAVIEMANASGLRLLQQHELNPMLATSAGTGQQIKAALQAGAKKIIIGMGGSATVDGGCGILSALGVRFLDKEGAEMVPVPAGLSALAAVDLSAMDSRLFVVDIIVLCDVDNPLLGTNGAAAMFGPQKGASKDEVVLLENALSKWSDIVLAHTGKDMSAIRYGGTAGGAAAGLWALLGAKLVNGIDYFMRLTSFETALQRADIVVTGEGRIDEQTLQGKAPFGVAICAKNAGRPVIGMAGSVPLHDNERMQACFDVLLPISQQPLDLPTAMAATGDNLSRTAMALGNLLAMGMQAKMAGNKNLIPPRL